MKNIWWYFVLFWVKLAIKLFYRRIEVHGADSYPTEGPVLLAPNHQNAFMDALIPAVFAPNPIHFLVRADIFKSKWADGFLRSLNMMPVYRQRDGLASLAKNEEVFEQCFEILRNDGTLLLFPEMTHKGEKRLRPLSKGFTRITFGAMQDHEHLRMHIVPLGINYSHYQKSNSRLIVNWGKPIAVSDYAQAYQDNPAKAMSQLKEDLQKRLASEIVHITRADAAEAFDIEMERIAPFFLRQTSGFSQSIGEMDFYKKREFFLQKLPLDDPYFRRIGIYEGEMNRLGLSAPFFYIQQKDAGYWVVQNLLLIIALPLFMLSWLLMAPSYIMIKAILTRYVSDKQFWSSIKLVANLILFPIFGLVFAVIAASISQRPLFAALTVLAFYPLSVFVIRELRLPYRYLLTMWRSLWLSMREPDLHHYLTDIEKDILRSFRSSV